MEIYLDNSATTKCYECVRDIVGKVMCEDYGNPSSMHRKGVEAEQYIKEAKEIIAKAMKVQEKEIFFTSGGTESDNLALIGAARANHRAGRHLITSSIEHPAILNTMHYLEEEGFRVTYLPVDAEGKVKLSALQEALCEETILVSIMYVNNEMGAVVPVEAAAKLVHDRNPKTVYHVDAIQGYGKYRIYPKRMGIDLLSVSSHKIHGPKGVGFLYVSEKVKIHPMILGGGQQKGMRSGTDNVPGIAGLGTAARMVYENHEEKMEKLRALKTYLAKNLSEMERVVINGPLPKDGAPHIINASFLGVRSEVLLHTLEDKGIYVSAGSACSSHKRAASASMTAISADQERRESAIRFSLSEFTTKEELDYTLEQIRTVLPVLRKYARH